MEISRASTDDLPGILRLQKISFLQEARLYNNFRIQPLMQTLEELESEFESKIILKALIDNKIIGSVRADMVKEVCHVNKLMVHPGHQRQGIGKSLLTEIEKYFPQAIKFRLGTGAKSSNNIRLYEKAGYRKVKYDVFHDGVEAILMEKIIAQI